MTSVRARTLVALAIGALALGAAGLATAEMRSEKLGPLLCETTGGGRFVKIPGFRGEKIDRRLLKDVAYLRERFKIFVTDGYSLDPVHSRNGEHPIGLALDIVPDRRNGGTWRRHRPPRRVGGAPARIARGRRSGGSATTATRVTAAAITCISRSATHPPATTTPRG